MDEKIVLDKSAFRALASESRLEILKLLSGKQYTLSDFSKLLKLSNSTVKEHLLTLEKAGLIRADEEGRKWKYYSLTFKGRRFIQPQEVKVFFAFVISLLALPAALYFFIKKLSMYSASAAAESAPMLAAKQADAAQETAQAAGEAIDTITQFPKAELIILIVISLIVLSGAIYLLYKKYGGRRK
jgi:DNA-binding transcriptional ArsR family regulator